MRHDIEIISHGVRLSAWHYEADNDDLTTPSGRPCVVMAHGLGGTKDSGLAPFAERFAAAGADVVVFDYRGFGASEGEPRQVVDHRRHREDYQAVVDHVRALPGIDPDRIVLWGTSYSGGHIIAVAAEDPLIAGVISQGAAMDGLAAVVNVGKYAGPRQLLRLTAHGLRDVAHALLRRPPHTLPLVAPPGELGAMTTGDAEPGYQAIAGPTLVNAMGARAAFTMPLNRPVTKARRLRMPILLVMASQDEIAPPAAMERVAKRARGRVEVLRMDVGHFDLYVGDTLEESVKVQADFIRSL
jgi:pimeloyl-ACP methyl ester carboxylesterase